MSNVYGNLGCYCSLLGRFAWFLVVTLSQIRFPNHCIPHGLMFTNLPLLSCCHKKQVLKTLSLTRSMDLFVHFALLVDLRIHLTELWVPWRSWFEVFICCAVNRTWAPIAFLQLPKRGCFQWSNYPGLIIFTLMSYISEKDIGHIYLVCYVAPVYPCL